MAEVVNAEIPEFYAKKVKKERVAKSRKAKTDDPSQNKLMFPSAVAGTEGIVKKEIIPVQTALNFPTEKRKRARKTAKHDFSFSVEVNSVSSDDDDDDDFSPQKEVAVKRLAPVAYSKRPTKIIKYYFSSDEDD